MILLVYVDDIIIISPSKKAISWFKGEYQKRFKCKDLGELKRVLGIEVTRDRENRTLSINQEGYIKKTISELNIIANKVRKSEIPINGYNTIQPAKPGDDEVDAKDYALKVGKLIYLINYTRPDIIFSLGKLSQFISKPVEKHSHRIKALLRYIRSTTGASIIYRHGNAKIIGYSDANYAADKADRKSTLGQVFILGGGPISWANKK